MANDRVLVEGRAGYGREGVGSGSTKEVLLFPPSGAALTTNAHGAYVAAVLRGRVFSYAHQSVIAFNPGTLTTVTNNIQPTGPFALYNPPNSGVYASILRCDAGIQSYTLAGLIVYAVFDQTDVSPPSNITTATASNRLVGATASSAMRVYTQALFQQTPVIYRAMVGLIGTAPAGPIQVDDWLDGILTLVPGTGVSLQGTTTNAQGIASMIWEEVPIVA